MRDEFRKRIGAFYTPEQVTDVLCTWAVWSPQDVIVEPSFGGCNFLVSSIQSLTRLGSINATQQIHGFDIDPSAFEFLKQKGIDGTNFFFCDFLKSTILSAPFANVVLGNPPYLPIHKLKQDYKAFLFNEFDKSEFKIPKKSSLWIYFIVKAFSYLKRNGRMAWVVPDSIAFTEYGKSFLEQLRSKFSSIWLIRIEERYFSQSGTKEKTAFLLCQGYMTGPGQIIEHSYELLSEAIIAVKNLNHLNLGRVNKPVKKVLFNKNFKLQYLGDLFQVKIGIVLGATNLLVFNEKEVRNSQYFPDYCYPIITKGKQLKRLTISSKVLCNNSNTPVYLLDAIKLEKENLKLFNKFLISVPESVLLNKTFRKRSNLFGYDDFLHPDAFLTFYSQGLPKLIINSRKELNCTNSVHRVYTKDPSMCEAKLKFITLQLFSEFFHDETKSAARQYGNGILKFEPSDVAKIPVIIPLEMNNKLRNLIRKTFAFVERNLEIENEILAKKIAAQFFTEITN